MSYRAAVCQAGHIATWDETIKPSTPHCGRCGAVVLTACPSCNRILEGRSYEFATDAQPYDAYCKECGKPFPWRIAAVERAKRTLAVEADVEDWNVAVKDRASEMIDDIASDSAKGSEVVSSLKWLAQRGGEGAKAIIVDTIRSIGPEALKGYLKSQGLLP